MTNEQAAPASMAELWTAVLEIARSQPFLDVSRRLARWVEELATERLDAVGSGADEEALEELGSDLPKLPPEELGAVVEFLGAVEVGAFHRAGKVGSEDVASALPELIGCFFHVLAGALVEDHEERELSAGQN